MHKGIPTMYGGVKFRSRLEARWAAFFDQFHEEGLTWRYEPDDMPGYIPDFRLYVDYRPWCYAEVKPIADAVDQEQDVLAAFSKAAKSGIALDPDVIVVLGADPSVVFGYEMRDVGGCEGSRPAPEIPACGLLMPLWSEGRFFSHAGGCELGSSYLYVHDITCTDVREHAERYEQAWRRAGNAVQWRVQ